MVILDQPRSRVLLETPYVSLFNSKSMTISPETEKSSFIFCCIKVNNLFVLMYLQFPNISSVLHLIKIGKLIKMSVID